MLIAGFVIFFIGIIFIISYPINMNKNSRCTAQTQGTLTDIRGRFNSQGSKKDLHAYTYFVNGIEYRLETLDYSLQGTNNSYCKKTMRSTHSTISLLYAFR